MPEGNWFTGGDPKSNAKFNAMSNALLPADPMNVRDALTHSLTLVRLEQGVNHSSSLGAQASSPHPHSPVALSLRYTSAPHPWQRRGKVVGKAGIMAKLRREMLRREMGREMGSLRVMGNELRRFLTKGECWVDVWSMEDGCQVNGE